MTKSTFTNSTANNGSAIFNEGILIVTGSTFANNTAYYGGAISNMNEGSSTVNFNRIVGNTAYKDGNVIYSQYLSVDAKYNWWGSNIDPINNVFGDVDINPWMIMKINNNSTLIGKDVQSNIIVDLTYDSNDVYHDPVNGYFPNNTVIQFTSTLGNIPSQTSTFNGLAETILTGGTTSGIATVYATLDDEIIQTNVTIESIPPTINTSLKGGSFNTNITVVLNATDNRDPAPKIYYTIDGTDPTTNSTIYTGPITINVTTTLKFIAIDDACNISNIQTEIYTIDTISPTVTADPTGNLFNTSKIITLKMEYFVEKFQNPLIKIHLVDRIEL